MNQAHSIIVVDKSELASNLYRLLLKFTGAALIVRKRYEDVENLFLRKTSIDLAIFNSNAFGKKFSDILKKIIEVEIIRKTKKIFILRDNATEKLWANRIAHIPNSTMVIRPFHPDELKDTINELLLR